MDKLICAGISVSFGGARILSDISFSLQPGIIWGLIGPNGAGKTTLLNVLSGRLMPSSGRVSLGAEIVTGYALFELAKRGLFRSFQDTRVFNSLTAEENIRVAFRPLPDERLWPALAVGPAREAYANERNAAVSKALHAVGMEAERHRPAAEMSYGMRKRIIMAQAMVFDSTVCLLDEPLAGLDHATHALALQVIANLRTPNRIVLFVEHDLDAVDAVADRVLLMDHGRIVADGRPQEVRTSSIFSETFLQVDGR
jgi:ABC-type branched-subunit amino acid transport system ATPase component